MTTAVVLLVFVAVSAIAQAERTEDLTVAKIVEMSKAGLGNETIINAIISSNATFSLSVKDILYLKNEGVSEDVINFMLRSKPLTEYADDELANDSAEATGEDLPAYVQDATEGNYYDGYEYTDGYNFEDDRYSSIVYHYYGPWFRAYPYYFGFYYYPASYYYYCYWPNDYYYYFYNPRFYSWSYYYHYPRYYDGHYYYYVGGRYVKTSSGRYISRYGDSRTRYAVPRGSSASSAITSRSNSDKRKAVTSSSRYRSIFYNSGKGKSGSDRRITTGSTSSRKAVYRGSTTSGSRGNISIRNRSSESQRGKSSTISSRSSSSRGKISTTSRSSSSSRSRSSSSSKSSSSRTATKKK